MQTQVHEAFPIIAADFLYVPSPNPVNESALEMVGGNCFHEAYK